MPLAVFGNSAPSSEADDQGKEADLPEGDFGGKGVSADEVLNAIDAVSKQIEKEQVGSSPSIQPEAGKPLLSIYITLLPGANYRPHTVH